MRRLGPVVLPLLFVVGAAPVRIDKPLTISDGVGAI